METGCVFDGHLGQYIYGEIIKLAMAHGMRVADADRAELDSDDWRASETAIDLSERAELYLNDNVAEPGRSFGWYDGEYWYQPQEWWEGA